MFGLATPSLSSSLHLLPPGSHCTPLPSVYAYRQLNLVDGVHTLVVQATDALGLVEAALTPRVFVVDTKAPVVSATTVSETPTRAANMSVRFSCTGTLNVR